MVYNIFKLIIDLSFKKQQKQLTKNDKKANIKNN
jgi:hypothetical protein